MDANIEAWWIGYQKQQAEAIDHARREGIGEGREEEARIILLILLSSRFGSLPHAATARIGAADVAAAELWAERTLYAKTLRDVFGSDA